MDEEMLEIDDPENYFEESKDSFLKYLAIKEDKTTEIKCNLWIT